MNVSELNVMKVPIQSWLTARSMAVFRQLSSTAVHGERFTSFKLSKADGLFTTNISALK